jgi:hypothetical protein
MSCRATAVKEASAGAINSTVDAYSSTFMLIAGRFVVSIFKTCAARARFPVVMALIAFCVSRPMSAQPANERAVRAVADSFFAAIARERWDSAAALLDLTGFEPYFKDRVSSARSALPQREMTVEDMMANDSTMPRAVAEWQVAQIKKYHGMESFGDMSHEFAGVHTQHELFALTVSEAAARWLEAQDERTQMREARRRSGCSLSLVPPEFPAPKHNVLAVALRDDSTAYVVHTDDRFGPNQFAMQSERIMVLRRRGGRWRIETRLELLRPGNWSFVIGECPERRKQ